MNSDSISLELKNFLTNLTSEPGVYRMLGSMQQVLYVGKAANLKKRVNSYFNKQKIDVKSKALVAQIVSIEVHVTRSEKEALLLESSLIKSLRPKYNILMRDDKSYPFIHISNHEFPNISVKRFKNKPSTNDYYGPYPSVSAVHETVGMIQKVFKLRNCTNSYFNSRSRPCLQYQIKRCSAPCTNYISEKEYNLAVCDAKKLLTGSSQQILANLEARMQIAIDKLAFEEAAILRDQIKSLRLIQEQQGVVKLRGDADVIVIEVQIGFACVQCVSIRNGEVLSCESFFPSVSDVSLAFDDEQLWQQVFNSFILFYYVDMPERIPKQILTNHLVEDQIVLQETLATISSHVCKIKKVSRGKDLDWIDFALNNLQLAIAKYNLSATTLQLRYQALAKFLKLKKIVKMECFDVSHTQGDSTVASCVVFDEHGPCKREYRKFNINNIKKGDDYAAMEQAIRRRYINNNNLPDVLIIDGGKGQVAVAKKVLLSLDIDSVTILGVAKGKSRKAGMERLILADEAQEVALPSDSKVLHLLGHIRDEAHRFAITAHRKKREKMSLKSKLEDIEGIGSKRRQVLLQRFGGIRELSRAPLDELEKVHGISRKLAKLIYEHFH